MVCGKDRCQAGICECVESIPWSHEVIIGQPIPDIQFKTNEEPPYSGLFGSININEYPYNQPTLKNGNEITFGSSEMILVLAKFYNYPVPYPVTLKFYRPDGSEMYTFTRILPTLTRRGAYAFLWGAVGRYDNRSGFSGDEIVEPGLYKIEIITPYGKEIHNYIINGAS